MSIIHDALKKIQRGSSPASPFTDETAPPEVEALPPSGEQTTKQKPLRANTFKSILAVLCAIAITLGAFWFLFHQMCTYIPTVDGLSKIWYLKLVRKIKGPEAEIGTPKPLVPLAKITVNPLPQPVKAPAPVNPPALARAPAPANPQAPPVEANPPAAADLPIPAAPETLNIHGVMSNGKGNLVLINDQVYQEGDEVDGVKIIKIDLDYITVNNNGKEEKIRVND